MLGDAPSQAQLEAYLNAYLGDKLPEAAVQAVCSPGAGSVQDMRRQLERSLQQVRSF